MSASNGTKAFGDVAPALAGYTDDVLFGDALDNGVRSRGESSGRFHMTKEEIGEIITHLAFYAGWPAASTATALARRVFDEKH